MTVDYQVGGGIATITMDHPENRNALTPSLLNGLGDGLAAALGDPEARVVVLTNRGPAFCAGADLSGRSGGGPEPRFDLAGVLGTIQRSAKPVIARIAGHCMGGGVGLAAACDLSIAADTALFGFTEVRIGVAPAVISVVCLPKMRRADALELFLTGERVSAGRAAQVGLITSSVADEDLDAEVAAATAKILAGGPEALGAAKRLVNEVPGMETDAAFAWATDVSQRLFASEEAAEGMAAFREKRSPRWVP